MSWQSRLAANCQDRLTTELRLDHETTGTAVAVGAAVGTTVGFGVPIATTGMAGGEVGAALRSAVNVWGEQPDIGATCLTVSSQTTVTRDTSIRNAVARVLGTARREWPSRDDY